VDERTGKPKYGGRDRQDGERQDRLWLRGIEGLELADANRAFAPAQCRIGARKAAQKKKSRELGRVVDAPAQHGSAQKYIHRDVEEVRRRDQPTCPALDPFGESGANIAERMRAETEL